jgi:hypothetical protein
VIETNIRVYHSGRTRAEDFKIKKLKYLIANHFMERYEVKKLSESEEVVGKSKLVSARCGTHLPCNPIRKKPDMLRLFLEET